jgi:phosphoribosylanthranilate isomerase
MTPISPITPLTLTKVCGMRDAENIRAVERLGINLMGFIFWPHSSRYVSEPPAYLPTACRRVGVFVDATIDDVRQHMADYSLDYLQLHGQESPEYIQSLLTVCGDSIATIIKAFNIATADDFAQTKPYEPLADYFLFDTKGNSVGGNGSKFDWTVLTAYNGATPFILSGGIGPDDAGRVRAFHHPKCIGIDLNSRFELVPGLKDVSALRKFFNELNS